MVFAHGFGCDQNMWRFVEPTFRDRYRTVLFDHVGAGRSDLTAYDKDKYSDLRGYASDVVEIGRALDLRDAVFVGHSVSAMIGALASIEAPGMFGKLVMVGPSPRYIDDGDYYGGFSAPQIEELLASLADNHLGWSAAMAPAIMGNPDRLELGEELTKSFCRTDPEIAKQFARATFTSDNRADLKRVKADTLVLQTRNDIIASERVGEYVNREIEGSRIGQIIGAMYLNDTAMPALRSEDLAVGMSASGEGKSRDIRFCYLFRSEFAARTSGSDLTQSIIHLHSGLVTELHSRTGLSEQALWRLVTDGISEGLLEQGRRTGKELTAQEVAKSVLAHPPLANPQWQFLQVDVEGRKRRWFRLRGGCCRLYLTPGADYCTTCVLRPRAEQVARLRAFVERRSS